MKKTVAISLTLGASLLFVLSSCAPLIPKSVTHQVILNAGSGIFYDDKSYLTFEVHDGIQLNKINGYETPRPSLPNQVFSGWALNGEKIEENYIVKSDIELDATFVIEKRTYDITLNANGGYFVNKWQTTKKIYDVTSINYTDCQIPNHDYQVDMIYHFNDWYYDKECTQPVIYGKKLTDNIEIFADWDEEAITPFKLTDSAGLEISKDINNVYHINTSGTYNLVGRSIDSQINIDSSTNEDLDVILNLNDTAFYSSNKKTAILASKKVNTLTIHPQKDTINYIYDLRKHGDTTCDDDSGAISAKCDVILDGEGELYINDQDIAPGYNRAIQTSKKLTIKNLILGTYGIDGAIKAKQEIKINNADVTAISPSGDGLKTDDIDVTKKGNRNGDIIIIGKTTLDINCACDAIDASHDIIIGEEEAVEQPKINIATSKFSSYTKDVVVDKRDLYIRASHSPDTHYDETKYWCSVLFDTGEWERVRLKKILTYSSIHGPIVTNGYYYGFNAPIDATSFEIYLFSVEQDKESISIGEYIKKSESITISTIYNVLGSMSEYVNFVNDSIITAPTKTRGRYSSLTGSSNRTCGVNYSNKGLKADNKILINDATMNIKTYDDSIHTSYGTFYPGGGESEVVGPTVGSGDITILNGNINILSGNPNVRNTGDDAIHSSGILTIDDASIDIGYCYEGIEAPLFYFNGGSINVFTYDDGVNVNNQGTVIVPSMYINGGILDIHTNGNDIDGIDSNGNFYQNGGIVITRGNPSGAAMASGLDVEFESNITGGVLLCLGAQPESPPSHDDSISYLYPFTNAETSGNHTLIIGDSINYSYVNNTRYPGAYLYYLSSLGTPSII